MKLHANQAGPFSGSSLSSLQALLGYNALDPFYYRPATELRIMAKAKQD